MVGLQTKIWLLVMLIFGILYGVITGVGSYMGVGNTTSLFMGFQRHFSLKFSNNEVRAT